MLLSLFLYISRWLWCFYFKMSDYKYVKKFKLNLYVFFFQKTIDKIVLFLGSGGSHFKRRRASISSVFTAFVRGLVYVIQIWTSSKLISKECRTLFHSLSHDFSLVSVVVVYIYLRFKFYFLCFKVIIIHYHTPKQRKITFKPKINWTTTSVNVMTGCWQKDSGTLMDAIKKNAYH